MRTLLIEKCPLCLAESSTRSVAVTGRASGLGLRKCSSCSLVYARECAEPEEIYVDGYLTGQTQFGADTTAPWMQAHLRSIAHQRAEIIERAVPNGRRILDVGSGSGHFLDVMRERGWTVQGVEPVDESAAIAREQFGLDVLTSTLEDSGLPEASYDVVSLFHVVEHMQDTTAFVRSVSKWIRPGGSLVIEVPNFAGLARRRHSEQWIHLRPLEHVAHFTPGTLDYLFRHTDMEQWRIRTPTWIGYPLTVSQVIDLFGLPPAVARATRPISRIDVFDGESAMRPTEVGWKVWSVVESMYRLTHLGGLTLGIARTRTR